MKRISSLQKTQLPLARRSCTAFTLVELLVVLAVIGVLAALLTPSLARSRTDSSALRCVNNHRQLIQAWQMYAGDFNENLPAAMGGITGRPNWMTGNIYLSSPTGNSLWDTNADIILSPIWPYTAKQAEIFRCPSDRSTVTFAGIRYPRVRSVSMSQVFGTGEWLDGSFSSGPYRLYSSLSDVRVPHSTFVFADEHPDSVNDAAIAVQVKDAESSSPPGGERIIDFPASFHNGGCTFSFADGRVEIHKWIGNTIKPPARFNGALISNISAGDSGTDVRWLAKNTTVRK